MFFCFLSSFSAYFSKENAQNAEKIARFPGGEKGVESCHVSGGRHGFVLPRNHFKRSPAPSCPFSKAIIVSGDNELKCSQCYDRKARIPIRIIAKGRNRGETPNAIIQENSRRLELSISKKHPARKVATRSRQCGPKVPGNFAFPKASNL